VTLFFHATRFRCGTLFFNGALRRDPLLLGTLGRDPLFVGAPRFGFFVDRREDLFVLDDREDVVIFDVARLLDRLLGLDRLLRDRPLLRPRGSLWRGAPQWRHRRASILVDELFEQTAQRIRRGGAEVGRSRIARDVSTQRRDRATALLSDVVLELIVLLA
jgi:hypothetical protein